MTLAERINKLLAFGSITDELPALREEWSRIQNQYVGRPPIDVYFRGHHERKRRTAELDAALVECVEALASVAALDVNMEARLIKAERPALISLIDTDTEICRRALATLTAVVERLEKERG